ncbi:MAG TPA: hypothetical protein VIX13_04015 [Candidatus Eisenbacteria bacterium]
MKKRLFMPVVLAFAASLFAPALGAHAQEKAKEHPQEHPKEHPEHPGSGKKVSLEQIDQAIRAHIENVAKSSGGRFPVKDEVLNKTWQLELVRVHKDRLQALADGSYFACVDFKADDGTMVDVDFFLKKKGDDLEVTETTVHKINGKARYNYEERNGVWVKVPEKA